MQITWYGNSCFLIKLVNGKRLLMDPFSYSIGYKADFPKCNIITMSHSHLGNSYLSKVNMNTKVINSEGKFFFENIEITGLNSFHDEMKGLKRGKNIIYYVKTDNYSICHLGYLGHIPSDLTINKISNCDILFIPIGGNFTIDGKTAAHICKLINPKIIIPMNFKTSTVPIPLNDAKDFLTSMNTIEKINSNILDITNESLNCHMKILLFSIP